MPYRMHSFKAAAKLVLYFLLVAAGPAEIALGQIGYDGAFWNRHPASPGDWFDPANWNPGLPGPLASATIDNGGSAVIAAGHAEALGGWIGFNNTGALRITGGSAEFHWSLSLGYTSESRGALRMEGGELAIAGGLQVGNGAGRGDVEQSGGDIQAGALSLGGSLYDYSIGPFPHLPDDYGRGHYRMSGGALQATGGVSVGNSGVGRFVQDGGHVETDNSLHIGGQLAEIPDLGGNPSIPVLFGDEAQATSSSIALPNDSIQPIRRSGLTADIWFPPIVPSRGLYELNDGELSAGNLLVDRTGVYRQNGGVSEFDFVAIRSEGQFRLRRGELHAEHGFHSDDAVDLHGRDVSLSVGAGILDFSNGIAGAHNAHITAGPSSLTILPAGFNPNVGLGTFNRQGMVHVAGNDFVLPAGKRIAGAGAINDYVVARGQIAATGLGVNLSHGMRLQPAANVDLGAGALAAIGRPTTFQGGSLTAERLVVGGTLAGPWQQQFQRDRYFTFTPFDDQQLADSPGLVRHAAGDVNATERVTVLSGDYRISGGDLNAGSIDVGVNQFYLGGHEDVRARFIQTGGTVHTSRLSLSMTYLYAYLTLDGGVLQNNDNARVAAIDDEPQVWVPPPPPTIAPLTLIGSHALDSRYRLEAGELIADEVHLGQSWAVNGGSTRFLQTDGSLVSKRRITMHGHDTAYVMDGGQLTARRIEVGAQYVPTNPEYVVPDSATFAVRNADSEIEIRGELLLGGGSRFRAVPGTTIRMTNPEPLENEWQALPSSSFRNLSFNSDDLSGLKNLTLVFDGMTNQASTFEVAGLDLGSGPTGYERNFALDSLQVGDAAPASLRLVDLIDNQRNGDAHEALYVDTLVVAAGSTLDLGGLNLYYRHAEIAGNIITSGGAMLTAVPEPATIGMMLAATVGLATRARRRKFRLG